MARRQRFRILVGERSHEITVEPGQVPGMRRVTVDGVAADVIDAPGGQALVREVESGAQLAVTLDRNGRPTGASIGGHTASLVVRREEEAALEEALAGAHTDTGGVLKAPMPGRVVGVLVAEGDEVERGAPIVIIEAMKMENELHAPATGRVSSIAATVGAAVEAGAILCEITPHD